MHSLRISKNFIDHNADCETNASVRGSIACAFVRDVFDMGGDHNDQHDEEHQR